VADAEGRESGEPTEPQGREDTLGGSQEINGHDTDAESGRLAKLRSAQGDARHADGVYKDVSNAENDGTGRREQQQECGEGERYVADA